MIRSLPRFSSLIARYPRKHEISAKQLFDSIGGQVRASLSDGDNTCAIRMSYALNESGTPVRTTPGVHMLKGAPYIARWAADQASPTKTADLYIFRVLDVKAYLVSRYGPGTLIYDGHRPDRFALPIRGVTQGIIVFEWRGHYGAFGAAGHVDLFRVVPSPGSPPTLAPGCFGECFFLRGPMVAYFWETRP